MLHVCPAGHVAHLNTHFTHSSYLASENLNERMTIFEMQHYRNNTNVGISSFKFAGALQGI